MSSYNFYWHQSISPSFKYLRKIFFSPMHLWSLSDHILIFLMGKDKQSLKALKNKWKGKNIPIVSLLRDCPCMHVNMFFSNLFSMFSVPAMAEVRSQEWHAFSSPALVRNLKLISLVSPCSGVPIPVVFHPSGVPSFPLWSWGLKSIVGHWRMGKSLNGLDIS